MMNHKLSPVLKYKRKAGIYSNSTGRLTFNPNTLDAHSYRWWRFVAKVDGLVIFNNYRYSVSTSKHQNTIRNLLADLGIKIDLELSLRNGIEWQSLEDLIIEAEEQLCDQFLADELKRQDRNERARIKRAEAKKAQLESALGHTANCDQIYKRLDKVNLKLVQP